MLELLIVIVIMAIAVSIVAPVLSRAPASLDAESASPGAPAGPGAPIVADARRAAIRRGEPLRLRIAGDGVWALVSTRTGETIAGGRAAGYADPPIDVSIDPLGSCLPAGVMAKSGGTAAFDALHCTMAIRAR